MQNHDRLAKFQNKQFICAISDIPFEYCSVIIPELIYQFISILVIPSFVQNFTYFVIA